MAAPSRSRRGPGTRSGSTSGAAVQVVGLKEFRRELRKLDDPRAWTKELAAANKVIARKVVDWSRANASGMGGPYAHFAGAIRARGGAAGAKVAIGNQDANATFWGAKKRTGWYAAGKYSGGPAQHPRWVGSSWTVGEAGQGPYAINPAIAAHMNQIIEMYGDAVDDITRRAFPE